MNENLPYQIHRWQGSSSDPPLVNRNNFLLSVFFWLSAVDTGQAKKEALLHALLSPCVLSADHLTLVNAVRPSAPTDTSLGHYFPIAEVCLQFLGTVGEYLWLLQGRPSRPCISVEGCWLSLGSAGATGGQLVRVCPTFLHVCLFLSLRTKRLDLFFCLFWT